MVTSGVGAEYNNTTDSPMGLSMKQIQRRNLKPSMSENESESKFKETQHAAKVKPKSKRTPTKSKIFFLFIIGCGYICLKLKFSKLIS